ncbi:MAG: SNF2-related protein [Bacteroidales bacterium]|nr:SNF2-related protein [Bacteroidales bacterium]
MAVRLSNMVCPSGMSLEEWQVALREQQALSERFVIKPAQTSGEYLVGNPKSRSEYKVVYCGRGSEWNYCSCMDFKTSGLGTCKHLEAVRLSGASSYTATPDYTSVYLDYTAGRSVRIRFGTEHERDFRTLAAAYFGIDNCLLDEACGRFGEFLKAAREIDDSFRCYPDALDYVLQFRARKFRSDLVDRKCSDEVLDNLLNTSLYPYQKEGVRFALKAGKCIIADEMGLGKTPQAIAVAEFLRREGLAESALIVVPTSLKYQWKKEIERFVPGAEAVVIDGPQYKRKELYSSNATYRIVSYNAACNDIKSLGGLSCDLLILDEVQRLKNWNTQIARAARKIESQYSVILSGTPLENKLEELYSIVELADQYVLAPYFRFKDNHIVTDATGKVTGYRNLNAVGEKLHNLLIRRRKVDVNLQLPERVDKNLFVPMTHAQREMHDALRMDVAKQIQKWQRNHFLSEMDRRRLMLDLTRMRMVCDSTYLLDQESHDDTKLEEVMNIVCDICESGGDKVLIFSQWERMTRLVASELDSRGIRYVYLHGAVSASKRKDMVAAFSEDPDIRVFLSTDAGSTGLNLQAASTVINLDLPWNPAVLEQRIARVHRIGQSRNIQVINLIAANSIEENMIAKLRFKSSLFEGVLDGGEDSVFIGDDKFKKIIDIVGEYVAAEPAPEALSDMADDEPAAEPAPDVPESSAVAESEVEVPAAGAEPDYDAGQGAGQASVLNDPEDLISRGSALIGDLVDTLKSPEATRALVERLVVEDPVTGRSELRIPVRDKEFVASALRLLSDLLNR